MKENNILANAICEFVKTTYRRQETSLVCFKAGRKGD